MTEQRDKARQAVFITALVLAALVGSGYGQQALQHKTIHESTRAGDTADVKEYLRRGADVDAKDNNGETPLHWAGFMGRDEMAELLHQRGGRE